MRLGAAITANYYPLELGLCDPAGLLQVRIDDALDSDEIFTILMGDQVEPRREFIQNNALEVGALDI